MLVYNSHIKLLYYDTSKKIFRSVTLICPEAWTHTLTHCTSTLGPDD